MPVVDVELPALPGAKKAGPAGPATSAEHVLFPNVAVTVAHGHLFVASHYDFLTKVLGKEEARVKPGDTLADSIEYQQVTKALDQFGAKAKCARSFAKTDEQYRATYELIRQNKMPESETMLGRMLNTRLRHAARRGCPASRRSTAASSPTTSSCAATSVPAVSGREQGPGLSRGSVHSRLLRRGQLSQSAFGFSSQGRSRCRRSSEASALKLTLPCRHCA